MQEKKHPATPQLKQSLNNKGLGLLDKPSFQLENPIHLVLPSQVHEGSQQASEGATETGTAAREAAKETAQQKFASYKTKTDAADVHQTRTDASDKAKDTGTEEYKADKERAEHTSEKAKEAYEEDAPPQLTGQITQAIASSS